MWVRIPPAALRGEYCPLVREPGLKHPELLGHSSVAVRLRCSPPPTMLAITPGRVSRGNRQSKGYDNSMTAITNTYDEKVEHVILQRLHEHESALRGAERRLELVMGELAEEVKAVEHWQFVLEDYRKLHGLSLQPVTLSPVLADEYSHMGPTELVQYWSDKHDGEVVVKDLAKVAVKAGMFPNYRHASSSIYAVVKRKGYEKIGPGYFKRTIHVNGHNPLIPAPHMVSLISRSVAPDGLQKGHRLDLEEDGLPLPDKLCQ